MSDDTTEETLQSLHDVLSETLLDRLKNGETTKNKDGDPVTIPVTAATLNVARQWLNDNQVSADPRRHKGLKKLGEAIKDLPFEAPSH